MLRSVSALDERRRAASFGAFLHTPDSFWPVSSSTHRTAPLFATLADKRIFYNAHGRDIGIVTEEVKLVRKSQQYVSMSRFSEGTVFDRSGVSRGFGYLENRAVPWLAKETDGFSIDDRALDKAPWHDESYVIFFNAISKTTTTG